MAERTKHRGFLNYVARVHDQTTRNNVTSHYGTEELGKSRLGLYTNNFKHNDAITKITESDLANRLYEGREGLINTASNDNSFNPDFPNGHFSYGYNRTRNNLYEIKISGEETSSQVGNLTQSPVIDPIENATPNQNGGKYTANLNVSGLSFQGEGSPAMHVKGSGSGGFGNSADAMSGEPRSSSVSFADVHHNSVGGNPDSDQFTNVRGDSVSNIQGVITINEEGRLGSFSEAAAKDGGNYDNSITLQSP